LKNQFIKQLSPIRIYLLDSFADGTNTDDSDFDFYIVVDDKITDLVGAAASAYKAIRLTKQRPVDIIVGTESQFNK
jgi:predicted nucleotidyltransferase